MKDAYYYNHDIVIVNYSQHYPNDKHEIINSQLFDTFLDDYLNKLKSSKQNLFQYLQEYSDDINIIKEELKNLARLLLILSYENIDHPYIENKNILLSIIEEGYRYWRKKQRFSILYSNHETGFKNQSFIEADNHYSSLILDFYRTIQQNTIGKSNKVYRQLQAGTSASILLSHYKSNLPKKYDILSDIPFVKEIVLRTPLIIKTKSNKRENIFLETNNNPFDDYKDDINNWICFPCLVNELLIEVYYHVDYFASAIAMANLFELADREKVENQKADAILIFGNPDQKDDTNFYYDEASDLWVGKVSASNHIDYFGYSKKAVLTLHNLVMIQKGKLPIHGSMVNILFKNGIKKGIVFVGDSGAGKSETLEAINKISDDIIYQEVIFDDMGTIYTNDKNEIVASGSETGAFVRLDDLDRGTAYRDLDRTIFFNPERNNARVVVPIVDYEIIIKEHKVDYLFYANNYEDKKGLSIFDNIEDAKKVFVEGKRKAIGTTQEDGLSSTYFANPFGPMQKQKECDLLIDKYFKLMQDSNIKIGEVYTRLGIEEDNYKLEETAKMIINIVNNQ